MRMYGDIEVNGEVYIDLNEYIKSQKLSAIKLFTDEELKEELNKREKGISKQKTYIDELNTYDYLSVYVDSNDALEEIDNDNLLDEISYRGLNIIKYVEPSTPKELKQVVCKMLGINEFWADEEILDMLKEKWRLMI